MRNLAVDWKGYFTASPTPFTEHGDLDIPSFRAVVRYYLDEGSHGIVINGSSGEWYAQRADEREAVAEAGVAEVAGTVPAIVGVSSTDPATTARLIRHAGEIGADGIMLSPPAGWRLDRDELLEYYRRECGRTGLPVMVYNIPADVATNLEPELIDELADIENVVAVKESNRDDRALYETCRLVGDRIRVFGNLMNRPGLGLMANDWGADGYIGGGLLFGGELIRALEHLWAGDSEAAREFIDRLNALQRDLDDIDGNGMFGGIPGQLKAALNLLGRPGGYPRYPRRPVEGEQLEGLRRCLRSHGYEV